jgi:hypothetical protein
MKRFLQLVFALAILVLPQLAATAMGCSCPPISSPYKAFQEARAVFVGKVMSSKEISVPLQGQDQLYTMRERHYRFTVLEPFKGAKGGEVEVNAGWADSMCFVGYTEGATYLVYARGNSDSSLTTGLCDRTYPLDTASDDLYRLRAILKGVPEPRFYGSVTIIDYDYSNSTSAVWKPFGSIKMIVEGEGGKRFETVADEQGHFTLAQMPDGKYKARLEVPDKYKGFYTNEVEFVLGEQDDTYSGAQQGRSAYATFGISWSNQLGGRVLDAEGKPLLRAKPALLLSRPNDLPLVLREESNFYTPDGKYQYGGLKPGKYLPSVNLRAPFMSGKEMRFYYPGAVGLDQATEIAVGEGDSLTDEDIKLPPGYVVRVIEGVLVWPDGTPVEGGWTFIAEAENSDDDGNKYDWVSSSKDGHFSLQGFEGAEYWIHASVPTRGMKDTSGKDLRDKGMEELRAKPVKVTVGKVNGLIKLVIQLPEGVNKPGK